MGIRSMAFYTAKPLKEVGFAGINRILPPLEKAGDFLAGGTPHPFGNVVPSYEPGVYLAELGKFLPPFIAIRSKRRCPCSGNTRLSTAIP
jgi:hypothetical protein